MALKCGATMYLLLCSSRSMDSTTLLLLSLNLSYFPPSIVPSIPESCVSGVYVPAMVVYVPV